MPRIDVETVGVPATDMSGRLGDIKSANMVMFGGWIAKTGLVRKESALKAVENLMAGKKARLVEDNIKAILEGMNYVEHTKGKDIRP